MRCPRLCQLMCAGGAVLLASMLFTQRAARAGAPEAPVSSYSVVQVYPHDANAFTQGLFYRDGYLYESTGLEGHSSLRRTELETGHVVQSVNVPPPYFAEGIAAWGDRIMQLTWVSHVAFIYDVATLQKRGEFRYAGEGWGLTHDERNLIMSDGTDTLRYLDPLTFRVVRKLRVKDGTQPVINLNELEYINGEIFANVWQSDAIARISPITGRVNSWVDLSGLLPAKDHTPETDVLNGIAYDAKNNRLFVTGKRWPKLFEIKIVPAR